MRNVVILGATGSIGTQALEVIKENRDSLRLLAISAQNRVSDLVEICRIFEPQYAVISDESLWLEFKTALTGLSTKPLCGQAALSEIASLDDANIVLSSLVGFAGLLPTIAALKKGKTVALANKEVLVAGGAIVKETIQKYGGELLPVDSEHSAIYQCLLGEKTPLEKIYLTASGGPFFNRHRSDLACITPYEALQHPRWKMGKKVTIDSSTLANKGFEMIEACWLFDVSPKQIEVVIHPQSIIHSMVMFADGSIKAQLAPPDMRLPISFALGCGERIPNTYPRLNLYQSDWTFYQTDFSQFPMLRMCYEAMEEGGNVPAILNAADSVAVDAFLSEKIKFTDIETVTAAMLDNFPHSSETSLEVILETDKEVTLQAEEYIRKLCS